MRKCLGIEIGDSGIRIAYMEHGMLKSFLTEQCDPMIRKDMGLCAEVIRRTLKDHGIRCRNAVFVLSPEEVYVKRLSLPLMTIRQLKLNLPYEFHDYIGDAAEEYQFDYAVLERTGSELDLLAAACKKRLCYEINELAVRARLKLVGLVPAVVGLERIIELTDEGRTKDRVVAEFEPKRIRIHFFRNGIYDVTRTLETDCEALMDEGRRETLLEECRAVAAQIMHILNFYSYFNPDNTIDTIDYCGICSGCPELLDMIERAAELPVRNLGKGFLKYGTEHVPEWEEGPQIFGALLK